jgi:hypothetical protein
MQLDYIKLRKGKHFPMYLINERYKRFEISFSIESKKELLELIEFLQQVEDIFDLQFFFIKFHFQIVRSGDIQLLIDYLKKRVPDIPIPFPKDVEDPRLKNKKSIFNILDSELLLVEGKYEPKYSRSLSVSNCVYDGDFLISYPYKIDHFIFDNEGSWQFQNYN